jgi:PilZ domain
MAQKRRYSRLPFPTESTLDLAPTGPALKTDLIDISLKGALVRRPPRLEAKPGATAVLIVRLPDTAITIRMQGILAHVSADRLGLHCTSIDMDSITHLRRLLELNLGDPGLLERELLALG